MIYATHDGLVTIVAAADDVTELDALSARLSDLEVERPDPFQMMSDDRLAGFRWPPYLVTHANAAERDSFIEKLGITVLRRNALVDTQKAMLDARKEDPYSADATDERKIGAILGIEEDDPWDKRSEEQKAQDEEMKKHYEEAKKAGTLSGDSFGGGKNPDVKVTDVHSSIGEDGKIVIDEVLAVKGLHADNDKDREAAEAAAKAKAEGNADEQPTPAMVEVEIDDDLSIDPNGAIAIYFKVDVEGVTLADVEAALTAASINPETAVVRKNRTGGAWMAFPRQIQAEEAGVALTEAGFEVEVYGVNDKGERLVPKGASVVDTEKEEVLPPRIWNDRASEIVAMDEDERKKLFAGIKGKEFLYCGTYEGADWGCILYVVPAEWFKANRTMYPEQLDIAHVLPRDLKEVKPGVYNTRSRDWNSLAFDLSRKGFVESMALQLYLNAL